MQIEVYMPFIDMFVRDIDKIDSQFRSLVGEVRNFGDVKT